MYSEVYKSVYAVNHSVMRGDCGFSVKLRLSLSVKTRVLGAQKNRIIETVVLSTHQIFLVEK